MKNKKKTYAEIAEALTRKEQKYQKMLDNARTKRERSSAELMLERVAERRDMLMQSNRTKAEAKEGPNFGKGGDLPKYGLGSDIEPPIQKLLWDREKFGGTYNVPDFAYDDSMFNMPTLPSSPSSGTRRGRVTANPVLPGGLVTKGTNNLPTNSITGAEDFGAAPLPTNNMARAGADIPGIAPGSNGSILDKGMDAIGLGAPFMDNFALSKYIDNMKSPARPELHEAPVLKTDININPQLADSKRAQRMLNRSLDQSNTSRGVANNAKIGAFAKRMDQVGKLRSDKENRETMLKNKAAMIQSQIGNRNKDMVSQNRQNNIDFDNEKAYTKYLNTVNIGEDIGNINGQRLKRKEQEDMLKVLKPYYDRFGLLSKRLPEFLR